MVFMSEDLTKMLKALMTKFVKQSVLESASSAGSLAGIYLDKAENLIRMKKVDVGFAVKAMLENLEKDSKITQLQLLGFFTECQRFLKTTTTKLLERCPLKYPIVRNLTALDPRHLASHPQSASSKFEKLLKKLMACKRLTPSQCDVAMEQFGAFVSQVKMYHQKECSSFSCLSCSSSSSEAGHILLPPDRRERGNWCVVGGCENDDVAIPWSG